MNYKESEILALDKKRMQVLILEQDGQFYTQSSWYSVKKNGEESKHQYSVPVLASPKNVGRSNETTSEEQALLEYSSAIEKLRQKGYRFLSEPVSDVFLPMLAKVADLSKLPYPVYAQPKLDGTRATQANGLMSSRKGKLYLPRVVGHLIVDLPSNLVLDGELILPREYTFQQSISAIKKFDPELSPKLQFVVYDIYDYNQPDLGFLARTELLKKVHADFNNAGIVLCQTTKCLFPAQVKQFFSIVTTDGYEGAMIRLDGPYSINKRSSDLLKYKEFLDSEFRIVDIIAGEGSHSDSGIFVCETESGKQFRALWATNAQNKIDLLVNRDRHIGKILTVKYQELTDEGLPRFPVAIKIKEPFE